MGHPSLTLPFPSPPPGLPQLSIALLGLLNLSLALEDPFDNQGMDGIYIDEALYEVEQVGGGVNRGGVWGFLCVCAYARVCE